MSIFKVKGKKKIWLLILNIIIAEGIGAESAYISMISENAYKIIKRPIFSPPGWVFPIVWVILYFLMAIAAYRIMLKGYEGKNITKAITLYYIQLLLNFLWTIIFFKFNQYAISFIELIILLIFILLTTFKFLKFDKLSGILMIPYIIWVSFAGVLNLSIYMLNMIE